MATLKRENVIVIIIALLILLLSSLRSYFRADDFAHLLSIRYETSEDIARLVTKPEFTGFFRPVVKLFFLVNYSISGLNAWTYIAGSVAIFVVDVYVYYWFVRAVSRDAFQAEGAVLLLVLQMNTYLYAVNWIGAVSNVLAALFVMTSVLFYIRSMSIGSFGWFAYAMSVISFSLGLLSKESCVVIPLILMAYDALFVLLDAPGKARVAELMILRYVPFGGVFVAYLVVRNASGSLPFSGGYNYTLNLGANIIRNGFFYGVQLGYLPGAVFVLALPSLLIKRLGFERKDSRVMLFGVFVASVLSLPVLALSWSSPTWLFPPAIGTTLAASVLLRKCLAEGMGSRARFVLYGVLASALLGAGILYMKLSEARWLQWGSYTKNVLQELQRSYPELPHGAEIYFVDRDVGKEYGIERLFRNHPGNAIRLWFDDLSLGATTVGSWNELDAILGKNQNGIEDVYVFEYADGHVFDMTDALREGGR